MATEPDGYSADDREMIRLAKSAIGSRLPLRWCIGGAGAPAGSRRSAVPRWYRLPCGCCRPAPRTWRPAVSWQANEPLKHGSRHSPR